MIDSHPPLEPIDAYREWAMENDGDCRIAKAEFVREGMILGTKGLVHFGTVTHAETIGQVRSINYRTPTGETARLMVGIDNYVPVDPWSEPITRESYADISWCTSGEPMRSGDCFRLVICLVGPPQHWHGNRSRALYSRVIETGPAAHRSDEPYYEPWHEEDEDGESTDS